jgi:hypothetical protein
MNDSWKSAGLCVKSKIIALVINRLIRVQPAVPRWAVPFPGMPVIGDEALLRASETNFRGDILSFSGFSYLSSHVKQKHKKINL